MSDPIYKQENEPPGTESPPTGQLLPLLADSIAHRAELVSIELGEMRTHATGSALLAIAAGALLILGGFALTFLVAVLVWDSPHRAWWVAGLCVVYLGGGGVTGWLLVARLRRWQPFEATATQLQLDHQCLTKLLHSVGR